MTKFAVLSDIHANIHALDAVLETLSSHDLASIYCTGDIVGYGTHPNDCIKRLKEIGAVCIRGNHDRFAVGLDNGASFNNEAYESGLRTRENMTEANQDYLLGLTDRLCVESNIVLAHGSPDDMDRYLFDPLELIEVATEMYRSEGPGLCFVGHTHLAAFADCRRALRADQEVVSFDSTQRVVINPGSVGQSRDGNPAAAYALVDMDRGAVLFNRVSYDSD